MATPNKLIRLADWPFSLKSFALIAIALGLIGITTRLIGHAANTPTPGPGGTYSDWYFPASSGYSSLEWTFVPIQDPAPSLAQAGLLHYYAYNFAVTNATSAVGSGYAGFQTNGLFNGAPEGEVINFSIWGSNGGTSPTGLINPANTESGGYQIMLKFPWTVGDHYSFQLKAGASPTDSLGKWWGLWVTNQATGTITLVGQERVPATMGGLDSTTLSGHTSMFGEDTHWWNSINGATIYNCSDFQSSAMVALHITAQNGSISPASFTTSTNSGQLNTGSSGYITSNCPVQVYSDSQMDVQHNLGSWSPAATNYLASLEKPGDINGDSNVDVRDLAILSSHFRQTGLFYQGDLSGDGVINLTDYSILALHWGK